jgi:DNA polymerase/3'-5' exonuclease PolX
MAMMQNEEIAKVLDQVGDMLEIEGENFFRMRAYRNAARSVRDQAVPVPAKDSIPTGIAGAEAKSVPP